VQYFCSTLVQRPVLKRSAVLVQSGLYLAVWGIWYEMFRVECCVQKRSLNHLHRLFTPGAGHAMRLTGHTQQRLEAQLLAGQSHFHLQILQGQQVLGLGKGFR
jgi:hypothetical protein